MASGGALLVARHSAPVPYERCQLQQQQQQEQQQQPGGARLHRRGGRRLEGAYCSNKPNVSVTAVGVGDVRVTTR